MATSKTQRSVIWVIAIVMAVGTLGSFFIFMLPSSNTPVKSQAEIDYEKQLVEYQKQAAEAAKKRKESSKPLEGYSASAFNAAEVTSLTTEDLVAGDGQEVSSSSTIEANYFGWTADGVIFDSTNQNGTVSPATFSLDQVIDGWKEGLAGAKVGGVRLLSIPTDKAYGPNAAANGQPAGPLRFIVQIKAVK